MVIQRNPANSVMIKSIANDFGVQNVDITGTHFATILRNMTPGAWHPYDLVI